ncbi:MAG: ZIP family metal transporter [Clostridiales bacterium]|nr:ZIP family metal transporter [Clostridiales bacterium]
MDFLTASILCYILPVAMTTLGSALIFFFKKNSKPVNLITMGLASGIMLSASIWSLLVPAVEQAEPQWGDLTILPVCIGFTLGGLLMVLLDLLCRKLSKNNQNGAKTIKFFTAMTVHNIPEGLSIGFALGSAFTLHSSPILAFTFALGIAIQNLPEGLATALPIYSTTQNKKKSFVLGMLSGIVEPISTLIGFYLASTLTFLQPWLLAFSAGAIIFVIVEELMPELSENKKAGLGTISFLIGFILMMVLDLTL